MHLSDDDKQLLMMYADGEELSASDLAHATTLEASAEGKAWLADIKRGGDVVRDRFAAPEVSEERQAAVVARVAAVRPAELRLIGSENRGSARRAAAIGLSFAMAAGFIGWFSLRSDDHQNVTATMLPSRNCVPETGDGGTDGGAECSAVESK